MKISRLLMVLAVVSMVLAGAGMANAVCTQSGKIVEIVMPVGAALATVFLAQNTIFPLIYHVYTIPTTNAAQIAALSAAMGANMEVQLTGSAAVCPVAGTIRPAGALLSLTVYQMR